MNRLLGAGLVALIVLAGCERSVDGLSEPGFTQNPNVFIDGFSSGLDYLPFADSKQTAFSVDNQTTFDNSSASMRFDVPNFGDPGGAYAGAIFKDLNGGRDLTGYNALTFYAKATKAATINEIGFGQDFEGNEFQVSISNLRISTGWEKFIIPFPDASRLTQESGMFWFAEGPENNDGYTFWIDELKFENLSTIAQLRPFINDARDDTGAVFVGQNLNFNGVGVTVNTVERGDVTVNASTNYFTFNSTNTSVANIDENGVTIVGEGSSTITAQLGDVNAEGSINVTSVNLAPTPTRDASNVISIFSDAYTNVPVDYYNGFFNGDGQTTLGGTGEGGGDVNVNGNRIINYTQLNFVGIGTFQNVSPIDATEMTHLHVDIFVNEQVDPGDFIRLQLLNSVGNGETSGSYTLNSNVLPEGQWSVGLDIPLSSFTGLNDRSEIGLLFFISDNTISNIYVDNIYFYKN